MTTIKDINKGDVVEFTDPIDGQTVTGTVTEVDYKTVGILSSGMDFKFALGGTRPNSLVTEYGSQEWFMRVVV